MHTISVSLAPSPGFCLKSAALQPAVCSLTSPQPPHTLAIPKGLKVFVNIAYDPNVPPPPHAAEDAVQQAMLGEDAQGWFVPVVVSDPRADTDKAGKPSVVFDCVYHSSLKPRALTDAAFKTFLIELAFQRIEAIYAVPLARQIGTPNIKAKGSLGPRTVQIPASLFPEGHPALASTPRAGAIAQNTTLIEELAPAADGLTTQPKGILKKSGRSTGPAAQRPSVDAVQASPPVGKRPELSWSKNALTEGLQLNLAVPELTHAHIPIATLDVEPRRLILAIPPLYALDLDLDLPDVHIREALQLSRSSIDQALMLKRQRDLDVDSARAEWRVAEGRLVIHV